MKKNIKKALLFLLIIALIAGATFAIYSYTKDADKRNTNKVAQTFISHLLANEKQKAYDMSAPSLKSVQSFSEFSGAVGNVSADKPVYGESSLVRDGEYYLFFQDVEGLPKTQSGRTDGKFTVTLSKEDGSWKVRAVSVQ